ncbi:DUF1838 family protein [Halioxenophilus sp. WMMB6]|uniref:DUF1838 family protein n=1 Tax=Halioxenophilus sp. WMMB6 TaxID=3073815 RepID=UPI00295F1DE5|nr:DUF1838 family protein [Halioxenophilus sp. WMMB6]
MSNKISRRAALKNLGALGAAGITLGATAPVDASDDNPRHYTIADLDLSTPEMRNQVIAKVMGSIAEEETHAFLRFHVYGYAGKNIIPFFSLNNYVVQKWQPMAEPGSYQVRHYEVGYYAEFDTDKPISHWQNAITGETIELEQFVLGPVVRQYTPAGVKSPGIAPKPLRVNVIGDRVFVPAQSIESFPNMFSPEEWPELSNEAVIYWDSMYTYSASLRDVLNPKLSSAPAEIHAQNLTSWHPYLRLGRTPGRIMVRAFGTNFSGFDALEPNVRSAFEKYTPEIFDTDNWTDLRFDSVDYYQKMMAKKKREQAQ